jgi:hypothetical protein
VPDVKKQIHPVKKKKMFSISIANTHCFQEENRKQKPLLQIPRDMTK